MFSSVAFGKTSTDFTDLKDLPADQKAIFDAMISAGIFDGVTDTTFGLNDDMNRAQFAKIAAKILGLDATGTVSSFSDVKASDAANGYAVGAIEALKVAKVTDGVTDTTFDPAGKVTKEQLAAFLIRALGKDAEARLTPAVNDDTVSVWAKGYVAFALDAKLVTNEANGKFGGTTNATRALLVNSSFAAKKAVDAAQAVSVASVTATGAKKLTVSFNKAVDTTKAVITAKRGSNDVAVASVTWSDDKTTATVNTSSKLFAGDYTISVAGLSDAALTKTVTAADEKVSKISIPSDKAAIVNSVTNTQVTATYKVTNQYGEDITKTTSLTPSSTGGSVSLNASNGIATITAPGTSTFTLDQKVTLTLISTETAVSATQVLTVSPQAKVAKVEVSKLYNVDGKTLTADSDATAFELVFTAYDQYGNVITDLTTLNNDVLVSVSNTTVASVAGLAANHATFATDTIDGNSVTVLKLAGTLTAGTSVVTLISASSGNATTFSITVANGVKASNFVFGGLDNVVATSEQVNLPVTATDLAGNEITDTTVLNDATKGVRISGATGVFTKVNGKVVFQFTAPSSKQTLALTAISADNKVATKSIEIKDAAVPAVLTGFTSDVNTAILLGQAQSINKGYLVVQDQYGRAMSKTKFATALDADGVAADGEYRVSVADSSSNGVITLGGTASVSANVYAINNQTSNAATLTASVKGTESVTFTLQKYDLASTSWKSVSGSDYTATFRAVDQSELTSYGVDDIGKVFNTAAYAKSLSVFGLTSDKKKVSLPATLYSAIADNVGLTITSGSIDATAVSFLDGVNNPKTEVTANVTVTINKTGDSFTKSLTATTAAPTVDVIEVRDANNNAITSVDLTTASVAGTFNINKIAAKLYAKDQYGKDATSIAANGVITLLSGATKTPIVTISSVTDGKADATAPVISNNGTAIASIANVGANDSFTVTIAVGSKSVTVKVNIVN
jgi:hypothetical protein